ncbi:MAG: metal-dependent hydrolase [Saprospiraceae bacterium]|nr:metal-dependent hydrolase [Saprospiraceae bacterium]
MSLNLTFLGHSAFHGSVESRGFFIDPFVSPNPKARGIDLDAWSAEDIFLSHAHQDHIADAEDLALRTGATIVSNYEIATYYGQKGLNGFGMNFGGTYAASYGAAKYVVAHHSSSFPDGSYGGCPGGFVFMLSGINFYFAGDTSLFGDMALIPKLCGPQSFAILPIGGTFTMDVKEAIEAAKLIDTNVVIGCHYDTFAPIEINHQEAIMSFADEGIELLLPSIGETLTFGNE